MHAVTPGRPLSAGYFLQLLAGCQGRQRSKALRAPQACEAWIQLQRQRGAAKAALPHVSTQGELGAKEHRPGRQA